jgi:hypothetical protein
MQARPDRAAKPENAQNTRRSTLKISAIRGDQRKRILCSEELNNPPPRANVFDQCGSAFRLLNNAPDVVTTGHPINSTQRNTQGPGVASTSYVPSVMPTQGPGVAPTTSYVPSVTPMQGPGVAPSTSYIALGQGNVATTGVELEHPGRVETQEC